MRQYVAASLERLEKAKRIADESRSNEALHKVAMVAVFALEDCHEALVLASAEQDAWAVRQAKAAELAAKNSN